MSTVDNNGLVIAESDYQKLLDLIENTDSPAAEALDEELSRADIVPDHLLPANVVRLDSRVTFRDLENGEETTVTLVMPRLADVTAMRISVLSPVGSALMGLAVGGSIQWPVPGGHYRTMAVVAVTGDTSAAAG